MLTGVGGPTGTARATRYRRRHGGDPARETSASSGRRRRAGRALAVAAVAAAACAVLFALALRQSVTSAFNADGAANVLQARALLHGNLLLSGWWTSDVSFYPTELPEYAVVTAIRGLSPDVVHICGALTYTLTVVLAAQLARGRGADRAGIWGAGLAVGMLLAPSIIGGTEIFLENPDHAGTAVPVLLVLLLLDGEPDRRAEPRESAGRRWGRWGRWGRLAAVCALLALTQVADELSLAAVTIPVAVVCCARLLGAAVRRSYSAVRRAGATGRPEASARPDLLLLAAALVSVAAARLAERAIRTLGGFHQRSVPHGLLAPLSQAPRHAAVLWQSITVIFGANNPGTPHRALMISRHVPLVTMADLHVAGLLLAAAGGAAGVAALVTRRADRVTQVLVAAIAAVLAAGVFSTVLRQLANAHEVAILLPLSAALAGRTLPLLARPMTARRWPSRLAAAALAGWLVLGLAEMGYAATWPRMATPGQAVAAWLVAHHQRDGLAAYWQADATTVDSGGRVLVAPVQPSAAAPQPWETSSAWYDADRQNATFVIAVANPAAGAEGGLSAATVRARFGRPAAEYQVAGDIIMTYRYNLLTRLTDRVFAR